MSEARSQWPTTSLDTHARQSEGANRRSWQSQKIAELEDDPGQGAPPGTGGSLPRQHGGAWGEPHAQSRG